MAIQPIVFDTTYVLPLFGINTNFSAEIIEEIKSIWIQGHPQYLPEGG